MQYDEYEALLNRSCSQLKLEPHCIEIGPFCTPTTTTPNTAPWQMEWCVLFPDRMYLVVRENWWDVKGERRRIGYRKDFAFHYGPANPKRNHDGIPVRDNKKFPAVLRIDSDHKGPHLHFNGEDHILQARVLNLSISQVDVFDFVRAVLKHRRSGKGFDRILGFEILP